MLCMAVVAVPSCLTLSARHLLMTDVIFILPPHAAEQDIA